MSDFDTWKLKYKCGWCTDLMMDVLVKSGKISSKERVLLVEESNQSIRQQNSYSRLACIDSWNELP